MLVDVILVSVGVLWVLAATAFDIKTMEVPDWLSFSLIALAVGIRLLYSLVYSDWMFTLYGLAGLGAAMAVGFVFYYARIWGGGDSKLLIGVGAAFATAPFFLAPSLPFFAVVLANILVFGAFYGLAWACYLLVRNHKAVFAEAKKVFRSTVGLRYVLAIFAVVALGLTPFMSEDFMRILLVVLAVAFVAYYFLFIFIRSVENSVLLRKVPVSKLRVGDWIAQPVSCKHKLICSPKDYGLTAEQLSELKQRKVKTVLVRDGMAFVPAFAFGLVFSLVVGDIIFMLF